MLCARCGKRKAKINGLCEPCYLETHELFSLKRKKLELRVCRDCGKIFLRGKWREMELKEAIRSMLKKLVKEHGTIEEYELEVFGNRLLIRGRGKLEGCEMEKVEEKEVKIEIKEVLCDTCTKRRGGYYEALIHFRIPDEKALAFLFQFQENISKLEHSKHGIEAWIIDKNVARKIANLARRRGYEVKSSYKLVGMKKDKKLYREYYTIWPRKSRVKR